MLALILMLFITPTPGVAAVELDPSDPRGDNSRLISQCLTYTGECNIWYLPGTYKITKPIDLPTGIQNVYFQGTVLVPCGYMKFIFTVTSPSRPEFHNMKVDASKSCGDFKPPLWFPINWT